MTNERTQAAGPVKIFPPLAENVGSIAVFLEKKPYFGATLVHIPFLYLLRRVHPGARLTVLSPARSMDLLANVGAADEFVHYSWSFSGIRKTLRAIGPDLVFVLRPASRGLDLAVASCRPRASASYRSWLGRLLYSRLAPPSGDVYRARKYLALLMKPAAALAAPLDGWFKEAAAASALPVLPARTLAVLPGGGSGDFKLWGLGRFIGLCEKLAARDASLNFLWILGPQEAGYRGEIEASGVSSRSRMLLNAPLQDLAAAALASAGAVGNDCGPAHVFQMCGCPFTCVLSDLDGRGQRCAEEWLDASNRPFAALSDPGRPITEVKVETVLAAVLKRLPA